MKNNRVKELTVNIIMIFFIFALDQYTKYIVENNFKEVGDRKELIKDFFNITYVRNEGVAFGLFQGKIFFIVLLGLIAIVAMILYLHKKDEEHSNWSRFGYIFILGGAFGNLFDRLLRGYVVDFIDFAGIWKYIFNVADIAINIGIILMLLEFILEKESIYTKKQDKKSCKETKKLKKEIEKEKLKANEIDKENSLENN
ncbi:MAG: signal peptidase II [Fusobacteria bacterium]|nr:signal peptidase II [Fusobacteriota bacterium]